MTISESLRALYLK